MPITTLFWRPVNFYRNSEVRASSVHTSIWGLGRIWGKFYSLEDSIIKNVNARMEKGTLTAKQAATLPVALLANPKTSWRVVASALSKWHKDVYTVLDEKASRYDMVAKYGGGVDPASSPPDSYEWDMVEPAYTKQKSYGDISVAGAKKVLDAHPNEKADILAYLKVANPELFKALQSRA